MNFEACREYTIEAFISVGPLLMLNACDGLQDVVTDVSPGLVAVILGEKSGFPSARLVDTGMSVVSVLTGQHSWLGGGEIEESYGVHRHLCQLRRQDKEGDGGGKGK
jgi:hypothetical protein